MKTLECNILAAMLGRLYGTFEPVNPHRVRAAGWAWQHRDAYVGRYGGWSRYVGLLPRPRIDGDAAAKKREQRAYNALEGLGLVRLQKKLAGLTEEGLREARQIVGMIQIEEALPGLDFILERLGGDEEWIDVPGNGRPTTQGYISEASLAGFGAMPKGEVGTLCCPCTWVPDGLMPLLVAGLVEFDYQPNFSLPLYCMTEDGAALANERKTSGAADAAAWLKLEGRVGKCWSDPFMDEWEKAKREMERAQPIMSNVIHHPMNGFTWPRGKFEEANKVKS